jgi:hypothetical protein
MILSQRAMKPAPAENHTLLAPALGWNVRDPLDGMKEGYAITLDNYLPVTGAVQLRRGYVPHATGLGGVVETVAHFAAGGVMDLLAAADGNIWDVTAAGAGVSLAMGFTNDRWQTINFADMQFWFNGDDDPQTYDGATVAATGWTGPAVVSNLISATTYKNRVYAIEKNTGNIWYAAPLAITGAMTKYDISGIGKAGGSLVAIGSVTAASGENVDDYLCALFSTGMVMIFTGDDPGATNWSITGTIYMGPPIGYRPLVQLGSDLIVITADGFMPMKQFIVAGRTQQGLALSDKIRGAVTASVRAYGSNFGWAAVQYPKGAYALFNIPITEDTQYEQYVINTTTGAWCRFKGMNGVSWAVHNENLYFGSIDGNVYLADTTFSDNGTLIDGDAQTAYHYFGGRGREKQFNMVRPIIASQTNIAVSIGLGVDFQTDIPTNIITPTPPSGALWGVAEWGIAEWSGSAAIRKNWQSVTGFGYCAAIRLRTSTMEENITWYSTGIIYQQGAFL